jgi:hypothetical protein
MGVVRFAIGFPPYILCGRRPDPISGHDSRHQGARRDPAHAGPHDEGRSVLKDRFLPVWRETGQTFSTTGARCSRMGGDAHSHLRDACAGGNLPGHRAHFTEKEMVDLAIAIGLMNVFNRIAIGFGCDPASS